MNYLGEFFAFVVNHRQEMVDQTIEHIGLTGVALTIAILIGLPLGIVLTRFKRLATGVLGIVGVVQTVPSVALLGFMIPLLGIGAVPAIVALFLYALLPIVRNTYAGIDGVDPDIVEAAKGMGMSNLQILVKVELPLSVPVIFAGIRTATVINVGIATLCALIASGGLGTFIFRGIALNNINMILAGAIPAALLALFLDGVLGLLQRHVRRIIKPLLAVTGVLVFVVVPYILIPTLFTQEFKAGVTAEFMERSDGYPGLKEHYDLALNTVELDPGLMYRALREKKVDVISGFSTDGRIDAYNLRVLEDDKSYFPPYYAAPLVRGEIIRRHPELREVFARLAGKISNEQMQRLNYRVDDQKETPEQVAKDFLEQLGFKIIAARQGSGDIVVGAKNFTEQFILAHIFELMIESYTDLDVVVKAGLGGTKISFDALLNKEIDLYPEYTGTGLLVMLDVSQRVRKSLVGDKDAVYDYVKEKFKERYDAVWLQPLGFNNTYALMMREEQAERLSIKTISDLKRHLEKRRPHGA